MLLDRPEKHSKPKAGIMLTCYVLSLSFSVPRSIDHFNLTLSNISVFVSPLISCMKTRASFLSTIYDSVRQYWSSPDTCRSFCHNCGATVSYWCGQRPDELDIAVGILRSEEGSMARKWLGWIWGRCTFAEESIERETCDAWLRSAELMIDIEK